MPRPARRVVTFVCLLALLPVAGARAAAPPASTGPGVPPVGAPVTVSQTSGLTAVACGSSTTCVAVGPEGQSGTDAAAVTITDGTPGDPVGVPSVSGGDQLTLSAIACPSATLCEAVGSLVDSDGSGAAVVVAIHDGVPAAPEAVPDPGAGDDSGVPVTLTGIACSNASTCVAVGEGFDAVATEIGSGTPGPLDHDDDPAIGLLSTVVCSGGACEAFGAGENGRGVGVALNGAILGTAEPIASTGALTAGGCAPATTSCALVGSDERGRSVLVADTSGSLGAPVLLPGQITGVACPTASLCVATGSRDTGAAILVPVAAGTAGPFLGTPLGTSPAAACASATSCVAVGTVLDDMTGTENGVVVDFGASVTQAALNVGAPRVVHTRVTIPLDCAFACAGTAVETATVSTAAKPSRSHPVTIGRSRFSLTSGGAGTVVLEPNAAGHRLLRSHPRLPVEITVTAGPGDRAPVAAIRSATLRAS